MMKTLKKLLKILGVLLVVMIGFLFAAPYLFKPQILALIKKEINKSVNAKTEFKDLEISFFKKFPRVSLVLEDLSVVGIDEFSSDTLLRVKAIEASVNIKSIIAGDHITVYAVNLENPSINAIIHQSGRANWDIIKPDSNSNKINNTDDKPFSMELKQYSIVNGYISYQDQAGNMSAEIIQLQHEGKGDFKAEIFTLITHTNAESVNFNYGGIPYLVNTNTNIDADIQVDNKNNKYSFKTDKVSLNQLLLSSEGFFQLINDSVYSMDISYKAPSTDFKHLLSLIPAIYKNDFKQIDTRGTAIFNGFVKGIYSNTQIPAYHVNLSVKDGFFQYPDLPKPVKNINLAMTIDNPDGVTDHTVVDISAGHLELDNDPFDFKLIIKNPISDLFIDGAAKGKLDLSKITSLIKLEPGTKLSGLLNADLTVTGRVDAIQQQQYDQFKAAGIIDLDKFYYASNSYPDGISLATLKASFNPKNVVVSNISGNYLNSNFSADGKLDNFFPFVLKDQPLEGNFNIVADKLNLNDWMGVTSDTALKTKSPNESAPFAVPSNLYLNLNAKAGEVTYDNLIIKDLTGSLEIANESIQISNIKGNALDGTMLINGSYSTKDSKKKPMISLAYEMKDLDVEKTFLTFNTVQKLMPIGQFIAGKLNSQLTMKGRLGENMMPDLTSLTGNGNMLLIEGFLSKFKPLEELANILNIKELDKISVRDVKNYIEFSNGLVMVKPFKVKTNGIEMEIGGFHGFDQSLDYIINMKVPRSLMGEKGNAYINNLIVQVNNKGIPVKVGEIVPIQVKMTGFIKKPIIKTDIKQTTSKLADDLKQQVTDFAKAKIDSTKKSVTQAVKDSIESAKKQALAAAADELKKQIAGKTDSTNLDSSKTDPKKKLEETGKGLIKSILGRKKKDSAKTGG